MTTDELSLRLPLIVKMFVIAHKLFEKTIFPVEYYNLCALPHRPHSGLRVPSPLSGGLQDSTLKVMTTNNYREKLMNKDQVEGLVEEVKGKVKEAAGVILDDKGMEIEGNVQKNVGKVQSGFGDLKEDIKEDIDSI